jgi:alpha-1,3-rhamnosyltransferase
MQEYILYIRTDLDVVFGNVDKYPVVGIIMPLYNHGKYLHQSLKSIIEQDYPNKLIIIVDDKSTDDSLEVAKSFINIRQELKDKSGNDIWVGNIIPDQIFDGVINDDIQVVLIGLQNNAKQANARNMGISTTWNYCNYYCQLDADDEYLPGKLSKSMAIMLQDPDNIGLVYSDAIIKNSLNGITTHEFRENYSYDSLLRECIISNTPLINKKVLADVGLYDKEISLIEDYDLWLRICEKYMAIHIPELLHVYHVCESSCTLTYTQDHWKFCWNKVREKMAQRRI